jgi:protein-tyrosine-phosphatase
VAPSLLVFVCAHNACRSAIAHVIAADEAVRRGIPVEVASAGTHALFGYAAASIAQATTSEIGLSLEHHRSQPANADLIARATLVVTMTDAQRDMLHAAFTSDKDKILSFNDVTHLGDVPDPIGGNADAVRAVRDMLQTAMPTVFEALAQHEAGPQSPVKGG